MKRLKEEAATPGNWVLVVLILLSSSMLFYYRSHLGFMADDWTFMFDRTNDGYRDFVTPYANHCVILLVSLYWLFFSIFGLDSAMPLHVFSVAMYMTSVILLYAYIRSSVGAAMALVGCAIVLFLGASLEDLLWPFQLGYSLPIAAGIGALLLFRRKSVYADIGASLLLTAGVLTTSLGIPFLLAGTVELLSQKDLRRTRIFSLALPVVVYAAWWLVWGSVGDPNPYLSNHIYLESVLKTPAYVLGSIQYVFGVLTGTFRIDSLFGTTVRSIIALAVVGLTAAHLYRRRRIPRALLAALAGGLAFWIMAGVVQIPGWSGRAFDTGRYQYPSAVFLLMILAAAFQGTRPDKRVVGVAVVVATIAIVVNVVALDQGYNEKIKPLSDRQYIGMTALEIGGAGIDPAFEAALDESGGFRVSAGAYLAASDKFGTASWSADELQDAQPEARNTVDQVLASALPIEAEDTLVAGNKCDTFLSGTASPSSAEIPAPRGRFTVQSGRKVDVSFGRFGDGTPVGGWTVAPGSIKSFRIPGDRSSVRWRLGLKGNGSISVCR
jgi:hypothetical protein